MDTLTKSCSPTIVITANGEVQTHEEATVYVKELDIFLTMKVFDNTPAVLSLGKLCDEHGYSHEWINGQKPTENFVPIVVPGLSTSLSSCSHHSTSKTPLRQERPCSTSSQARLLHQRHHQVIMRLEKERTELKMIPLQCLCQVSMLMIERGHPLFADSDRASSEILEWLPEFREILADDEVPERRDSHASSSHKVSLEPTFKRRVDLGKHSVYTHFPKDRNCEICQRTKISRAPCRRRVGGAVPRAENFGKVVNLETITDMQSWCKTWPLNGSRHIHAKQKLHKKPREACKSSWSPIGSLKSFILTIPRNSAELVKISPGIIARLHHIDQKQMGLLKEQCAE